MAVPEDKILVQIPEGKENAGLYELAEAVTVTFDAANGTEQTEQKIVKGTAVEEPEAPAKGNDVFEGWYLGEADTAYDFTEPVTENTTLTAHWKAAELKLSTTAAGSGTSKTAATNGADMGAFFVKLNGTVLTAEQLADVTWSSDNTEIASVGEDGIIKPGAEAGTATITAEYDGLTATGTVKVNEAVAEIDGVGYTTVSAALTAVKGTVGKTVKILKDQSLAGIFNRFTLDGSYDFTLDLNEKTLDMNGAYFTLNGAKMTVTNGTINVKGNMTQLFTVNSGELTIGETAVINGTGNVSPVAVFGPATVNTAGTLTAENTFAIAGNGTAGKGGYTINITGGKISSGNAPAVYHPNEGTVNISGGTITGATAVYQKSGTLNITGGTLAGKGNQKDYTYNGNGANATGDALVVDNCGYPGGAPETAITGGVFISDNASAVGSYAYGEGNEAETGFIEGGVFSDDSDTTNVAVPEDKILVQIPEGEENAGLYELADAVTVTFDAANGTELTEQKIVKGTAVEEPEVPVKEGYYLLGWFAENSETAYYFDTEVAENLTLTAKWVRIVEIPTAASGLIYTRSELTGVAATDDYNVEEGAKTDAGDYIATVTLKDAENTIWSDFTTEAKTIDWKIEPKDISNAVLEAVGTQNYTGSEITPELTVTLEEPYGKLDPATDFTPGYSENTAVGIASYWAEGKGNYTGKTDEKNFSITGTSISKATITLKQDDAAVTDETYTYDGNAKEPTVVVTMTINGKEVTLGEDDFTATFYNNVNAGEAAVFVVGEGSFAGGQVVEFKINPAKVAKPTASDKSYTGEEQKGIEEGEHYTLIGDYKATDVGTYTAIASLADSNYAWADGSTASVSLTWKITEANATFVIKDIDDQTYTGKAITPDVEVTATPEDAMYEVTYNNNVEIGEATVTVAGTGSYTGTATKTFNIVAGEPKVAKIGDVTYPSLAAAVEAAADGDTIEMIADEELDAQVTVNKSVTIDLAGHKLYNDNSDPDIWNDAEGVKAWSLISVQSANVVITGDGTLQAKVNDSYAADVREGGSLTIENGTLIGNISAVYVLEGALTVNGGDFSVQQKANGSEPDRFLINLYDANRTAGTAAATITGGTFHGFDPSDNLAEGAGTDFTPAGMTGMETEEGVWTVVEQTAVEIPEGSSYVYDGGEKTGVEESEGYTLDGTTKAAEVGEYTATATLSDLYIWADGTEEAKEITWAITPADLSSFTVEAIPAQTYTGSKIEPAVTVKNGETTLTADTDYTVTFENNTETGIAKATITGTGNYSGTIVTYFAINEADSSTASIEPIEAQNYTGSAITPAVTVKSGEKTLEAGKDYEAPVYYNNIEPGTATVAVTLKGNYDGQLTATFIINSAVAKIGDKFYPTLAAAVEAAADGAVIELIADTEESVTITDKAVTIDLGGNTLTAAEVWAVTAAGSAEVTLTNGNIKADLGGVITTGSSALNIEEGTVINSGAWGVYPADNSTLNVNGGEIHGVLAISTNGSKGQNATVNINGGLVSGDVADSDNYSAGVYLPSGTLNISGGTVTGNEAAVAQRGGTANVTGGELSYTNTDANHTGSIGDRHNSMPVGVIVTDVVASGYPSAESAGTTVDAPAVLIAPEGGSIVTGFAEGDTEAATLNENVITSKEPVEDSIADGCYAVQQEDGTYIIKPLTKIDIPAAAEGLVYNGEEQTGVEEGEGYTLSDVTAAVDAGEYKAVAKLETGYTWSDGTTEDQEITWSIAKAEATVTADDVSKTYGEADPDLTAEVTGTFGTDALAYSLSRAAGDEPGEYVITASGEAEQSNYKVTYESGTFTITPADLSSFTVDAIPAQTYTGSKIEPAVTVKNGETTLTADTDYTVAFENNTEAGIAKATITGTGNYSGTIVTYFAINEADSSDVELAIGPETCEYDGTAKKPVVTVTDKKGTEAADDDAVLTEGKDYDLTIYNNTDAGTATVIAILKGNYEGAVTGTFTITPVKVTAPEAKDYTYDGTEKTGVAAGENYTLTGTAKATDKGAYTVTAALNSSNYVWDDETTAPKELSWKISEKALKITIGEIANQTYTGSPVEPELTITGIPEGVSYETVYTNNVEAGTAKVTVTVTDPNYSGSATAEFKITGAPAEDLSSFTVEPIAAQTYTGSPITPAVTVKDGDKTLTAGTDYTAEYKNNTETGVATVTITGKGDYTGTIAAYFAINEKDAEDLTISDIPAQGYTGSPLKPAVLIKDTRGTAGTGDDITLTEGLDYNLHYINNVNEGTATVIAILKGNYEGSLTTTFEITKPKATFTIGDIADQTYTGSAIEPEVTVTAEPADATYEVTYSNNTQTGTATVTVTATGKYSGSAQKTFKIVPAAHVHKLTKHAAKAATCTAAGNSAYWSCSDCGKYFSDEAGTKEIAADSWVIPAKGHQLTKVAAKAATCTKDGTGAYYKCSVCGKMFSDAAGKKAITAAPVVKATGHSWGSPAWTWNKDHTKATAKFTCTKCKETKTVNASIKKTTTAAKPGVAGKTEYVATATLNGKTYTDKKTVTIPALPAVVKVTGISVSPKTKTLSDHDTVTLKATVTPSNAANKKVTWKSSNTKVATVDANGKVTTKAAGTAVITATAADGSGKSASCTITAKKPSVSYRTHVQTYGWQNYVKDGAMSGTQGEAKRLEGINIKLENAPYSGSIVYRTHVQTYGWQTWKKDNQMSGTEGEAKRLEGIQIYLTGEMAKHYDVYYRVHAQTYGWLDWAKNGVMAGTSGLKKRLEGINIVLVPKGGASPGGTSRSSVCGNGTTLPPNPYKEP